MSLTGRESIEAGQVALEEFSRTADAAQIAECADELLAVTRFLADQPRLRRALSDPARDASDRQGLARTLIGGHIGSGAASVVAELVKGRWGSAGELLNGVESLAISGLLEAGSAEGNLAEIEDQLFRFKQVVDGDNELSGTLGSSGPGAEGRAYLVGKLLDGKANPVTVKLAAAAAYGIGGRSFLAALEHLVEAAAAKREERVAYVTVARPLSEEDERKLAAKLTLLYGMPVGVKLTVDPSIVGGIRVQVGSDLYDGTVERRLTEARLTLAGR
ncbi:F0F1 ATP synthase subunit delta [Natronoglycomyces albus]|uniref:ATP synthase subunit delta n=1 Tax=Natronoglycomyces albus TaxID=2811108 RepID=A0A895XUG3_9ACTN|nr:F0F1 ATP synthase subunit delta [Natronoglycomyces albus]QSB06166.1 F0F1 ATP synthase subunit delta [Natronoglycomyces albus]